MRRSLELCASAVVAAVALATALGGLDALLSWSAQAETNYVSLAAVALAALAGVVSMLRRAIAVLVSGMAPGRTKNLELARLMTEARTDNLTGLANHRAFYDDLAGEIARRNESGSTFSLMAIDLDGLKAINDTRGHQAGDAHIVRYAHRLRTEVGSMGTVYRTGGDEFMILLPDQRNWNAINLAHAIHGVTALDLGARALSIGVTESTQTEHRQALVRQADLALYEAKRAKLAVVPYRAALEPAGPGPAVEGVSPQQRELAAALARAVDARDHGTSNHSGLVAELAVAIAVEHGLGGRRLERLRVAGLLHDVGKIAVPDAILRKATPLATKEQDVMRDHVAVGHDILAAAGFVEEAGWVMHHHEHFDGSGYPEGRAGEEISLESRIIAVADAFEAMTGARPYREKLSTEQALAELRERSGTQFDPSCVRALAALVGDPAAPGQRLLPVAEEPSLRLAPASRTP
ncbi:MAG: diguanylate cyclase [Gaiellaceae bacterium MAG52_C11]|nr:diguanylate cyclase [Candidatus Gaiellasilicea maunaloa]